MIATWLTILTVLVSQTSAEAAIPKGQRLKVGTDGRFLVTSDDKPFFYLADTGWGLFQRLDAAEAERYFKDRAAKRFNVIQAVLLSGEPGEMNRAGRRALRPRDPDRPWHRDRNPFDPARPDDAYFDFVDRLVSAAARHGLWMTLLPTWGHNVVGPKPIFDPENARAYGRYLGRRFRDRPVIWALGGDTSKPGHEAVWSALAEGLARGDGGIHLRTYHPGIGSSSALFPDDAWLDFHMIQSGHSRNRPEATSLYGMVARDYALKPTKPVLDAEANYENIPDGLRLPIASAADGREKPDGRIDDFDVRTKAYWSVFAGACGCAYGANGVIAFTSARVKSSWRWQPGMAWEQALDLPGSNQLKHLRALMESRPYFDRVPDQSIIKSKPGMKYDRVQATRAADGSYAMVYSTSGGAFSVDLGSISGPVVARWYDPRTGAVSDAGRFPNRGTRRFEPPTNGRGCDWVLVLDDEGRDFPRPGGRGERGN